MPRLIVTEDEKYMKEAIKQARKAYSLGEVPIGCVIVHEGKIIGRGYNRRNTDKNTLAHAEISAIRKASKVIGDWRLEGCTLYVTLEPCQMCAGAIVQARIDKLFSINGTKTVDSIHKKLGNIMWEYVGMAREEAGLKKAIKEIAELKKDFYENVKVPGTQYEFNQELEKALRLADFLEIGELMAYDALNRNESCGGHFREEMQTEDGETKRDDKNYMYVAAWEYKGENTAPELHKEALNYENIHVVTRNYKD